VGAAYLVHIGVRTFRARGEVEVDLETKSVSTFAQVVSPGTPVYQQVGYGLFMSLAHLLWFGVVAVFFSHDRMRTLMLRGQKVLNKVIGSVLAGLGISLAFAPSH